MMTRKRTAARRDRDTEPGQDSFLDVVANLIGILIILVMLIGSQAQSVWQQLREAEPANDAEIAELEKEVLQRQNSVAQLKIENNEIEAAIVQQKQHGLQLRQQRDRLQLAVQAIQETIDQKSRELSAADQQRQAQIATVAYLQEELADIQGQAQSLESSTRPVKTIEHLPTPIAKTVFGEEVHFRLRDGRLVHVPLNELVIMMRSEWKVKAKKLVQAPSTIETVGPVNDFRLQYKLIVREEIQTTERGIVRGMVPDLDRFVLLPTQEPLGEPFDQALLPDSQFNQKLNQLDPQETTISVWVYPDSFGQFNELKKILVDQGFLCAGWPLPENQPISGSPKGFRTAAQ